MLRAVNNETLAYVYTINAHNIHNANISTLHLCVFVMYPNYVLGLHSATGSS